MFSKSFSFYGRPHQRQHNQPTQSSLLALIFFFFSRQTIYEAQFVYKHDEGVWCQELLHAGSSEVKIIPWQPIVSFWLDFLSSQDGIWMWTLICIILKSYDMIFFGGGRGRGAETSNGLSKTFIKFDIILSLACTLCEESVTWASCVLWEWLRHCRGRAPGTKPSTIRLKCRNHFRRSCKKRPSSSSVHLTLVTNHTRQQSSFEATWKVLCSLSVLICVFTQIVPSASLSSAAPPSRFFLMHQAFLPIGPCRNAALWRPLSTKSVGAHIDLIHLNWIQMYLLTINN